MSKEIQPTEPETALFFKDEIYPLKKDIIKFLAQLTNLKIDIWEALTRHKLRLIDKEFDQLAARWIDIADKLVNKERWIKDEPPFKKLGKMLVTGEIEILEESEREIASLMDTSSKLLSNKRTEANFLATLSVSMAVLVVAVITLIVNAIVQYYSYPNK